MAKYIVSTGIFNQQVVQEASTPESALCNVLACRESHTVVSTPVKSQPDSHWTVQNAETKKFELTVSDESQATALLRKVRSDFVAVYWLIDLNDHSVKKDKKMF